MPPCALGCPSCSLGPRHHIFYFESWIGEVLPCFDSPQPQLPRGRWMPRLVLCVCACLLPARFLQATALFRNGGRVADIAGVAGVTEDVAGTALSQLQHEWKIVSTGYNKSLFR